MRRFIWGSIVGLLVLVVGALPAHAAGTSLVAETVINLGTANQADRVNQTLRFKTDTAPSSIQVPVIGQTATKVVAKSGATNLITKVDGQKIKVTTTGTSKAGEWAITLSYETHIVTQFGRSTVYQFGTNLSQLGEVTSEKLTLNASLELGLPTVVAGPKPTEETTSLGTQNYVWQREGEAIKATIALVFEEQATVDVAITRTLKNDGWWFKTVTLVLPPDTNQQQVVLQSLTPRPQSLRLDSDGNILAEYRLRPKQSVKVSAKAAVVVKNYTYALESRQTGNDIPKEIKARYTKTNETWKAGLKADQETDIVQEQVAGYLNAAAGQAKATDSYEQRRSVADKLIGGLRADGIAARRVVGYWWPPTSANKPIAHAWVEAYLPGVGWVTIDPAEGAEPNFGTADVRHLGLLINGVSPGEPTWDHSGIAAAYHDKSAPTLSTAKPTLSSTKYQLLPGLALWQTVVTMPGGIIVDDAALRFGEDKNLQALGSLAPLQQVTVRRGSVLASAYKTESVRYGLSGDRGLRESIASTEAKPNYWPMGLLLGGLALGILARLWLVRRGSQRARLKKMQHKSGSLVLAEEDRGDSIEHDDLIGSGESKVDTEPAPAPAPPQSRPRPAAAAPVPKLDHHPRPAAPIVDRRPPTRPARTEPIARRPAQDDTITEDVNAIRERLRGRVQGRGGPRRPLIQ